MVKGVKSYKAMKIVDNRTTASEILLAEMDIITCCEELGCLHRLGWQ